MSQTKAFATRLHPNDDLTEKLKQIVIDNGIKAAAIVTCVGSLREVHIRLADSVTKLHIVDNYEICSLVGTFSELGEPHLHISLSDKNGAMIGGHVLPGCKIFTTAEIVLLELQDLVFAREMDNESGYKELVIKKRQDS